MPSVPPTHDQGKERTIIADNDAAGQGVQPKKAKKGDDRDDTNDATPQRTARILAKEARVIQEHQLKAMIWETLSDIVVLNKALELMSKAPGDIDIINDFLFIEDYVALMYGGWETLRPGFSVEAFIKEELEAARKENTGSITLAPAEFEAMRPENSAQIEIATGIGQLLWNLAERLSSQSQSETPLVVRTHVTADGQKQKSTIEANEGVLLFRGGELARCAKRLQLGIIARLFAIMALNEAFLSQDSTVQEDQKRYLDLFAKSLIEAKGDQGQSDKLAFFKNVFHQHARGALCEIWRNRFPSLDDFSGVCSPCKPARIHNPVMKERGRKALDILLLAIYALPEFVVKVPPKQKP